MRCGHPPGSLRPLAAVAGALRRHNAGDWRCVARDAPGTDPKDLTPEINRLTETLANAGRFDQGVTTAVRAHELAPTVVPIQAIMLSAFLFAGRDHEGAERAVALVRAVSDPMHLGNMSLALATGGRMREARVIAQRLEVEDEDVRGVWHGRLSSRLALGDTSGALSAPEAAAAENGDLVPSLILASPWYVVIRTSTASTADSPEPTHAVRVEQRFSADELTAFHASLRNQHAIKRVAMDQGEAPSFTRVGERDREFEHPLRAQMVLDVEQQHARRFPALDVRLDRQLPYRGGADIHHRGAIADGVSRCRREA